VQGEDKNNSNNTEQRRLGRGEDAGIGEQEISRRINHAVLVDVSESRQGDGLARLAGAMRVPLDLVLMLSLHHLRRRRSWLHTYPGPPLRATQ
jgi:hypothetical protein